MKKIFLFVTLIIFFTQCRLDRQVVPVDVDPDEVYKPLSPNDDNTPGGSTFGSDSIPGFTLDVDFTTSNPDVYVYFSNLTLLDVNPAITQNIFEFIQQQLAEFGFINQSFSLPHNKFESLVSEGLSYEDAAGTILDMQENAFETQIATYENLSHFNISFIIYPVFIDTKFITYREYAYCYTGGAHGMTVSTMHTYELSTGKLLTIKDIIKPKGLDKVREEVAAQMAYSYPIYENITSVEQYIDSLNVWLDHFDPMGVTGNITMQNFPLPDPALTSKGLVFIYPMYELTPGADGCPLIMLPYKDIDGCLAIEA